MRGTMISEKTFELIKQMLVQGYSSRKIEQMLPEEIKVSRMTINKVGRSGNYKEYCAPPEKEKPEPEEKPVKVLQVTPYAHVEEIVKSIDTVNEKLDAMCAMLNELIVMLK